MKGKFCKLVKQTLLKEKNPSNTVSEMNCIALPCLPSGGSTEDPQSGHNTGETSAKERRQMISGKKK